MTKNTCISCNENAVDLTELYCFGCYLDREAESLINYANTHQLFLTQEAK
jgi:hypothetical protein